MKANFLGGTIIDNIMDFLTNKLNEITLELNISTIFVYIRCISVYTIMCNFVSHVIVYNTANWIKHLSTFEINILCTLKNNKV